MLQEKEVCAGDPLQELRGKSFDAFRYILPESSGQNLALTVLCVPYSLDTSSVVEGVGLFFQRERRVWVGKGLSRWHRVGQTRVARSHTLACFARTHSPL